MGNVFGKTFGLMFASFLFASSASADWIGKQMYTLNPTTQIYGPVKGSVSDEVYQSQVFRIILEEARQLGAEYLEVGDYDAYWAFVVGSLTVPLHEGSNYHFRLKDNNGSVCQERLNSGTIFDNSKRYSGSFTRLFKELEIPLMPECEELSDDPRFHQFLGGHDGSDMGIMQVNVYWHEKNFFSTGDWTSVRKSIRYGLGVFKQGFDGVYRNSNKYECVMNGAKVNYSNLIRAAWAGRYNSGNLGASCRFADPSSDWARNDNNFKKSLDKILSLDSADKRKSLYRMSAKEDAMLEEVIRSFKEKAQDSQKLTNFLAAKSESNLDKAQPLLESEGFVAATPVSDEEPTSSDDKNEVIAPLAELPVGRVDFEPKRLFKVKANKLNFRNGPGVGFQDCGDLLDGALVVVSGQEGDWIELVADENLLKYSDSTCEEGKRYTHKDFLVDNGVAPTSNEEPIDSDSKEPVSLIGFAADAARFGAIEIAEDPFIAGVCINGKVTSWVNVREDRPQGFTLANPTGVVLGPPGTEVTIAEEIWHSKNAEYPWYRIISPTQGWIYGKYVEVEGK